MQRIRDILRTVSAHRIFVPAVIAVVAILLGLIFAFEHTRNIVKVRGPYLAVLMAIMAFPVFAFRFFDPHEDSRPISAYFLLAACYFILLGSPDFVGFLRMVLFERLAPGAIKQLVLGMLALGACSGGVHYGLRLVTEIENQPGRFLAISPVKFAVYAVLQIVYLNLFVAIARDKFGITTIFG